MKKYKLILICFLLLSHSLLAIQAIIPDSIIGKQEEIKNFKVDIELAISTYSGQNSEFFFTYYYEEPDRIYLETDDYVLLPKDALKTLQPGFFQLDKYEYNYLGQKEGLHILELIPLDRQEKYRMVLALDPEKALIRAGELFFQMGNYQEEFKVLVDFAEIEGYSLPVYIEGKLAVPAKFGIGSDIKEYREGTFWLKLKDYSINIVLPESIKKKMSSN
ncbi:MAG TPA: hypothetical protein GXZ20_06355 [Halanaerobiaceae bacterium]|nr:hypothetical protein [Halanaerobiaceae bacterium]